MNMGKRYYLFLFLSTFTRGLVEVFSLVLLYQKGFSVRDIYLFLVVMYGVGIIVNYFSLKMSYRNVFVISSILYGISFFFLTIVKHKYSYLIILACLLSSSMYSYHTLRHLLALILLTDHKKNSKNVILFMYLGMILSTLVGTYLLKNISKIIIGIIILVLSWCSIIPIFKLNIDEDKLNENKENKVIIEKDKIWFSILEQFKVIFLELQPLFLYLYIKKSISYVGIFQVILNFASLIFVYLFAKKIHKKYFIYFCLILGGIFLLKLNIKSQITLFILAFFEGIFVKIYENISLNNLYDFKENNIVNYLKWEEFIFFGSKFVIMFSIYMLDLSIKGALYLCIIGIILSGLCIKTSKKT